MNKVIDKLASFHHLISTFPEASTNMLQLIDDFSVLEDLN